MKKKSNLLDFFMVERFHVVQNTRAVRANEMQHHHTFIDSHQSSGRWWGWHGVIRQG